jgi:hypothetical protein
MPLGLECFRETCLPRRVPPAATTAAAATWTRSPGYLLAGYVSRAH